ncbi:unnamed protein product [Pleuronectes platessa]|uniref:Uncharacterized protein n=1 Tax=Pleuronectes platessa TaxID=8262 RepID=A0A9N7U3P4_PLEPL|nr:unnamed protein product [Pleuronectes platessa]
MASNKDEKEEWAATQHRDRRDMDGGKRKATTAKRRKRQQGHALNSGTAAGQLGAADGRTDSVEERLSSCSQLLCPEARSDSTRLRIDCQSWQFNGVEGVQRVETNCIESMHIALCHCSSSCLRPYVYVQLISDMH